MTTRRQSELNKKGDQLTLLQRISEMLGGSIPLEEALQKILDVCIQHFEVAQGFILLVDSKSGEMNPLAARTADQMDFQYGEGEVHSESVEKVVESGIGRYTTESEGESILCVPLKTQGITTGVIYLNSPSQGYRFAAEDLDLLTAAASQVAFAIENDRIQKELQRVVETKAKYVSIISHELRLPMTSIKGYTDLLLQGVMGEVNENQRNFLEVIVNNVQRMSALVSNLSDSTKIETGRLHLKSANIQIRDLIEESVENYLPKIEEKFQIMETDLPDNLPKVHVDPKRLTQILDTLLDNAWKYTPEGGRIQVKAERRDGAVYIEVSDNGIGINPADQKNIFAAFFRSEDGEVREHHGWGLGLHVGKNLVELMGGEMGFESELGEGSAFWLVLPEAEVD